MAAQSKKAIYLDVCTLCRPFDDQGMMRIRIETDAYFLILQAILQSKFSLVVSPAHLEEVNEIADIQERHEILAIMDKLGTPTSTDLVLVRARAEHLHSRKFGVADAAHVAFAEMVSDVFISCDDRLLRKCKREPVSVSVMNPIEFVTAEDLR